jgi:hypothetical protein
MWLFRACSYKVSVRKAGGKRPLRRYKRRWNDNIKRNVKDVDWKGVDQDRDQWQAVVNTVMNPRIL